ncbi:hypothetical protein ACUY1T_20970 [Billgrantia sp. Q4P2]|uniref:hypothetical protein n=1 Tax=Billgrantia sp. Q4P2 TaxID=3463857 RepID=UPI0040576E8D
MDEIRRTLKLWLAEGYSEGELSVEPEWYVLWRPDEIDEINRDYELEECAPGFITFGGNGGGELLVVNNEGAVFYLPAIGMAPEAAIKIAGSLQEFKSYMEK